MGLRFKEHPMRPTRRQFTSLLSGALLSPLIAPPVGADDSLGIPASHLGPASSFSFEDVSREALRLARIPYRERDAPNPLLEQIDYDSYQRIRYRPDRTLHKDTPQPVQLFHLGNSVQDPVRISLVADGQAREILYRRDLFDIPDGHPALQLPENIGFAGFRIMDRSLKSDWFSMIGASYFRSAMPHDQYGVSARGIAVNTAGQTKEEFPKFVHLWLEWSPHSQNPMMVYALLDGPSVTGAYKMAISRTIPAGEAGNCEMQVEARVYLRADVGRVGIAPFSSMFWYGEAQVQHPRDWRPEVHDSDGIALLTGEGERIWRPLRNPPRNSTNVFEDHNPKGFGLLQRDRLFEHYLDDGVFYEKRPSVWVEPLGEWDDGAVHLVEMPTGEETWDNIVVYWCPKNFEKAGQSRTFSYRLLWLDNIPFPKELAFTVGTWTGIGGQPGLGYSERNPHKTKVVIDFEGSGLAGLSRTDGVQFIVSSSRGNISNVANYPVVGRTERWRAVFDVEAAGVEAIDLRGYLTRANRALSETWIYQLNPIAK